MKAVELILVRHGETEWNHLRRIQGQIDVPLNAIGLRQAQAAAARLAPMGIDALYTSDLARASQTAAPIASACGIVGVPDTRLRERHFGRCEGLTYEEVAARYADDARAINTRDPDYCAPQGGESRRQHEARVLGCVARLLGDHRGQTIVVVTHGGVLDVIYRRALGLPSNAPRDYAIPNAGINWLTIDSEQWQIERWGETAHLA